MKRNMDIRSAAVFAAALAVPVLYLAMILAYGYRENMTLFELMAYFLD